MNVQGTVEKINETQAVSDKFQKREFVVKHGENQDYPEYSSFEFIQDKCDILDVYRVGQEVEVEFNLKGRPYEDKKTGTTRYFNTLQAWKINALGSNTSAKSKQVELAMAGEDSSSDLPF